MKGFINTLALLKSLIKHPKNVDYEGRDPDENIVYIFRGALITNVPWIVTTVVLSYIPSLLDKYNIIQAELSPQNALVIALFWNTFIFGFAFYNFINWFFNIYIVTNKKIIDMDFYGIIHQNVSEALLEDIEDVTSVIAGAMRTIFNFGLVTLQTAGTAREFEFEDVPNPIKVRDLISDYIAEHKLSIDKEIYKKRQP